MAHDKLPIHVKQQYDNLLNAFSAATEDANLGTLISYPPALGGFSQTPEGQHRFECYLHLKGLSARSYPIGILLQVQETLEKIESRYVLTKSTVRVRYYKMEDGKGILLHHVRFDHDPTQRNHPIFHAQLADEPANLDSKKSSQLDFPVEECNISQPFKNSRIPTSDMTLSSVLLCIAADLLGNGDPRFSKLMQKVSVIQSELPPPNFEKTRDSIQKNPSHLRSSHWYM